MHGIKFGLLADMQRLKDTADKGQELNPVPAWLPPPKAKYKMMLSRVRAVADH
jgi:hypothetical protein